MENSYSNRVPVIAIVAKQSNTGKTTIIEGIIKVLKVKGYRIGVLKHDAHGFQIDKAGKDSYRFTEAGADMTIISSKEKLALIENLREEKKLEDIIEMFGKKDLIIIEGYKENNYPKIEVYRKEVNSELLYNDNTINKDTFVAIATDVTLNADLVQLNINNFEEVAGFIEDKLIVGEKRI